LFLRKLEYTFEFEKAAVFSPGQTLYSLLCGGSGGVCCISSVLRKVNRTSTIEIITVQLYTLKNNWTKQSVCKTNLKPFLAATRLKILETKMEAVETIQKT
jgi:hypothetical protein